MSTSPYDLNLRHLRAVPKVVARGSVSAAAADINLSQPALTQGLARLEEALGQNLFVRQPGGLQPTPAGRLLAGRVEDAMEHMAAAARTIRRGGRAGFDRPERLVTMTQVRAFIAVARSGSFVSAAEATGLSQPAIHSATRDLERLCGVVLVGRRGRGISLTAEGARLARGFRLAMSELAAAMSELKSLSGRDEGRIAVGAMPLSRARLLPLTVAAFHRLHPGVAIAIAEGSHAELIEPLRDGELDLLIGARRDPAPGHDVLQEPLFMDRLVIVARSTHPLARAKAPDAAALARFPWIVSRQGTPLRAQWERLFTDAGLAPPSVKIECGSVLALRGILLEDDFLTLLSPDQIALEIRSGVLCQIGQPLSETLRTIVLTTRAGWRPTQVQARFIDMLQRQAAETGLPKFE